jgi:hypothetical protein
MGIEPCLYVPLALFLEHAHKFQRPTQLPEVSNSVGPVKYFLNARVPSLLRVVFLVLF